MYISLWYWRAKVLNICKGLLYTFLSCIYNSLPQANWCKVYVGFVAADDDDDGGKKYTDWVFMYI